MPDLYLKAETETVMDAALIEAGLVADIEGEIVPLYGTSIDRIGAFDRMVGTDPETGDPIMQHYPEYHCNVRCAHLSDEAAAVLAPFTIAPPETPFRVWA